MGVAVLRGAEAVGGVVKRLFKVLGRVGRLKVRVGRTTSSPKDDGDCNQFNMLPPSKL